MDDFTKQYRFLKRHLFNEEVFKIKLKHYLDIDCDSESWKKVKPDLTIEEVRRYADEIYKNEWLVKTLKGNCEHAKECEKDEEPDFEYTDWNEIVDNPPDGIIFSELFPNAFEYLHPFGFEDG